MSNDSPFSPAASASGAVSIPATLAGCPDAHFPGLTCATCDDQTPAFDPACLVPFPPPEPATMWKAWKAEYDHQADRLTRDAVALVGAVAAHRAAVALAGFSRAIGSQSHHEAHLKAVRSAVRLNHAWSDLTSSMQMALRDAPTLYPCRSPSSQVSLEAMHDAALLFSGARSEVPR